MDITAFGESKPLEQQMEHALRAYPAHMGEDITNIMRAALVTIQCYKSWLAQAENEWYDRDGYDSYGYHRDTDKDRAGYTEWDYLGDGKWVDEGLPTEEYVHDLYDNVMGEWAGRAFPWEKTG